MVERVVTKQLAGVEDLLTGNGTVNQARSSGTIPITRINANHIPIVDTAALLAATDVEAALAEIMAAVNTNVTNIAANTSSISSLVAAGDVPNGSFEVADSGTPTYPEDWTVTPYSGGTVALDDTDANHGGQSVKCTSAGTGGGILDSEFIKVSAGARLNFEWSMISSVVDVRNDVEIHWYDEDQVFISSVSLYSNSTANPTSWTVYNEEADAPSTATYFKFKLIGCNSADVTVGTTSFDGVSFYETLYLSSKGADIASVAALPVNIDGDYHNVTGTTSITSFSAVRVGTFKTLEFDGILTLTHHATDLILPGGANIVTKAGDKAVFFEYASGDWKCISYLPYVGAVTGYSQGKVSLKDTFISGALFDADTEITESAWQEVGPTGSGAANIWTGMNSIPLGATHVKLRGRVSNTVAVTSEGYNRIQIRETGSSDTGTQTYAVENYFYTSGAASPGFVTEFWVPLDSNNIFECTWESSVSGPNNQLAVVGWME